MQQNAVNACIDFFQNSKPGKNGIAVCPTAWGKSLLIANVAPRLDAPSLVFQPSKEILEQNLAKFHSYGIRPAIFSASMGRKTVGDITLVTIGSVAGTKGKNARVSKAHLFQDFPNLFVDECDLVGAKSGQYKEFFDELEGVTILGVSATPWRMSTSSFGTMPKFLTRTRPRIFSEVVWYTQVEEMIVGENGKPFWAKLEYKKVGGFDRHAVKANSTGADFDDRSLQLHFFKIGFQDRIVEVVKRLKTQRKNALIFCRFVPEAEYVASKVHGLALVTADTSPAERAAIGNEFRAGRIWGVVNVGVYLVGFDFPELETIVLARPTKSLRVAYQSMGRGVRIHPDKESCWIVDMVGLTDEFGKLEDLKLYCEGDVKWSMWGKPGGEEETQLTNVYLADSGGNRCKQCGQAIGFWMRNEHTGNSAGLNRPTAGMKPNIVLRKTLEGKTVYAIPKPGDADFDQVEFVMHRALCGKQSNNGGQNG